MRIGLILAILIAVAAVLFALQNPGTTSIKAGTYTVTVLTPVLLILTFGIGALFGMLLTVPSAIRRGRRVKVLERQMREARPVTTTPAYTADPMLTDPTLAGTPRRESRL